MVKCAECGYLSARNEKTRKLEEIEEESRHDGNIHKQLYVHIPICFVRSYNLTEETKLLRHEDTTDRKELDWRKYVKEIINKERECEPFTEWHQGYEPKEHQEMIDREKMLKWQAKREDDDKIWRENQRKEDKRWRIIELIVSVIILGLMAGGFTILGAFISRGAGG